MCLRNRCRVDCNILGNLWHPNPEHKLSVIRPVIVGRLTIDRSAALWPKISGKFENIRSSSKLAGDFNPFETYMLVKLDHLLRDRDEHSKMTHVLKKNKSLLESHCHNYHNISITNGFLSDLTSFCWTLAPKPYYRNKNHTVNSP